MLSQDSISCCVCSWNWLRQQPSVTLRSHLLCSDSEIVLIFDLSTHPPLSSWSSHLTWCLIIASLTWPAITLGLLITCLTWPVMTNLVPFLTQVTLACASSSPWWTPKQYRKCVTLIGWLPFNGLSFLFRARGWLVYDWCLWWVHFQCLPQSAQSWTRTGSFPLVYRTWYYIYNCMCSNEY